MNITRQSNSTETYMSCWWHRERHSSSKIASYR